MSFMAMEVVGGLLSNSLALLSDAAHMLMDSAALGIAMFAAVVSRRGSDSKHTYGYRRMEVLGGSINAVLLIVMAVLILKESVARFRDPPEIQGVVMSAVALVGLGVNAGAMFILHPVRNEGANLRGAFLHVMGDFLGSVSAVVAGLGVWLLGWRILDPIASLVVAGLILVGSFSLLRECLHILLEGAPRGMSVDRLVADMTAVDGVTEVHDLHVWSIGGGFDILTAHVVAEGPQTWRRIRGDLRRLVRDRYGIRHVTLEFEESKGGDECPGDCLGGAERARDGL
ncbi:MAG: cation diffusion facilitator family transporter [Candidatus Eisenbacteria bacterium]|nr:cation diffusion facilitator family transporter [Candidatus Eisenbacteria bacterium]